MVVSVIHLRAILQEVLMNLIHDMCLKVAFLLNYYHMSQEPMS